MVKCSKLIAKITEKTKNCCQNKTGTTLRMSLKMLDGNDLPRELLLAR